MTNKFCPECGQPLQDSGKTLVNFILDKSGSMSSVQQSTISGFNEYVGSLKRDTKVKYEFSLTLFDTSIQKPYIAVDIATVNDLTSISYNPDGGTALYDAVCSTIKEVQSKVKPGQKVLTVIMTDGQENASKLYTQIQMKQIIGDLEKSGSWSFVYLGANQDSYAVAQQYGFNKQNISNFNATARGMGTAMSMMASNTSAFASSADLNTKNFFSAKDQDDLAGAK